MATTLPRPTMPPSGPLPSLPVSKTRQSSVQSGNTSPGPTQSTGLPLPSRSPSSASPVSQSSTFKSHHASISSLPRGQHSVNALQSQKVLRKTISIGSFPHPPKPITRTNSQSSSASPASNPVSPSVEHGAKTIKTPGSRRAASQGNTLKRPPRTSSRANQLRNFTNPSTPSLLNGGDVKSVSLTDLTSLPANQPLSPRLGRLSGYDDLDENRGRQRTDDIYAVEPEKGGKDGKGNVIVSVRVRPDAPGNEGSKSDLEWMVDGRRSLISYRGREGGEYIYGQFLPNHLHSHC